MNRYGCFEIRTTCSSCGQSLPINGPYRRLFCTACIEDILISPDIIAGFLNDFEEEYESLAEGQGRGGTLMSGSGTFKYSYWRMQPRCSSCKKPLSIPEVPDSSIQRCSECDEPYYVFSVPEWLQKQVPSARFCCTPQPPAGDTDDKGMEIDENSTKPIVMSCPQCAGALSVSARSERIMECAYCNSEVFVPDTIWKRLHPVRKTEAWLVCFEGKNIKQLQSERRIMDIEEEKEELIKWRLKNAPKKARRKFRTIFKTIVICLAAVIAATVVIDLTGGDQQDVSEIWARYGQYILIPVVILLPVGFVLRIMFSSKIGKGKECKQAIARLAEKHSWTHNGAEFKSTLGSINAKYRGRDIEINPGDDYAIEVEINNSPWYIKTDPPGWPHGGVQRFTTGDRRFDNLFPIRYATPELAERIEKSVDEAMLLLAPVYWFLDRWQKKLGRFKIDYSDAAVHLIPGHVELMESGNRYLLAEDLEPLLEDMIILAAGIEAISSGREPELP